MVMKWSILVMSGMWLPMCQGMEQATSKKINVDKNSLKSIDKKEDVSKLVNKQVIYLDANGNPCKGIFGEQVLNTKFHMVYINDMKTEQVIRKPKYLYYASEK